MSDFDLLVMEMVNDPDFGVQAVYIKQNTGEYDPATGTAQATQTNIPVKGILLDFTLQSNGLTLKHGTEIIAGDKQFLMQPPQKSGYPGIKIDPATDKVKISNIKYSIVTMKETNPTGVNSILYEFVLRR